MKKVMALVFAGLMVAQLGGAVFAGEGKDPGKWQEKRVEKMARDLGLTAEQKDKVAAIIKETGEARKAEMEKLKALKQDEDQRIKVVLTPEQAQKLDALKAERKAKMERKMKKAGEKCENGEQAK